MKSKKEIYEIINSMPLPMKVGQLFMLAYPGKDPEKIRPLVEQFGICGCYLSQDNAETFEEARTVSRKLQQMSMKNAPHLPLMLGVDQEGTWGVLLPESHTGPGNLALGGITMPERTRQMYGIFGHEMLSVGFNVVLGPCADVNSNPKSPIIDARSFGESPQKVSREVCEAVKGLGESGVLSALKHFPGHGDTDGDTHRSIPEVNKSLDELMPRDLLPFSEGIKQGADIVMTSHILYPKIDKANPATLSPEILQSLLRDKLNFKGLILSDSMNMGAIRKHYDPADSTLQALKAGVDLVMLSEEHYDHSTDYLQKQVDSIEGVIHAVKEGNLQESVIDEKLFRILNLKINKMRIESAPLAENQMQEFGRVEQTLAREAFVLLRKGLWPLPQQGKIVCVNANPRTAYRNLMNPRGIGPNQAVPAFDTFQEELAKKMPGVVFISHEEWKAGVPDNASTADLTDAANTADLTDAANAIIVVTENYVLPGEDFNVKEQRALVMELAKRYGSKLIILGLRSSYEISEYPGHVTYLCSYSSRPCAAAAAAGIISERQLEFSAMAPAHHPL